jgi:hypothetical protein
MLVFANLLRTSSEARVARLQLFLCCPFACGVGGGGCGGLSRRCSFECARFVSCSVSCFSLHAGYVVYQNNSKVLGQARKKKGKKQQENDNVIVIKPSEEQLAREKEAADRIAQELMEEEEKTAAAEKKKKEVVLCVL